MTVKLITSQDPVAAAAEQLHSALREVLDRDGRVRLAVPGGSALAAFGPVATKLSVELDRICLTWVDERCVPTSDEASNRGATRRLIGEPMLGAELPLYLDPEDPDQGVARVREGLRNVFANELDVVLLGMGADGHIASIFVGDEEKPGDRVRYVPDSEKPPSRRMTLTRATLATASHTILLATGENKRGALTKLLAGDPALPATGLPNLTVVTDLDLETTNLETTT